MFMMSAIFPLLVDPTYVIEILFIPWMRDSDIVIVSLVGAMPVSIYGLEEDDDAN